MRVVGVLAHHLLMRIELSNPRRTVELMSYLKHYGWSLRLLDPATIDVEAPGGAFRTTLGRRDLAAHVKAWEAFYAGDQARVVHSGRNVDSRAPKPLAA